MNEEELIEIIRQYEYVPRIIMERLFCTSQYDYVNNTIIKYLNRRLKQLALLCPSFFWENKPRQAQSSLGTDAV